jgi:hypothetical protein
LDEQITKSLTDVSTQDVQLAMDAIKQQQAQPQNHDDNDAVTDSSSSSSSSSTTPQSFLLNDLPGTSKGGKNNSRQLAIIYTCNVCNTRSAKKFTEHAYNHGVVLVRCPKCESLHLIADRLGFFEDMEDEAGSYNKYTTDSSGSDGSDGSNGGDVGDVGDGGGKRKGWDIEMFMKKVGKEDNIKVITNGENSDVLEVTMEDVVGDKNLSK